MKEIDHGKQAVDRICGKLHDALDIGYKEWCNRLHSSREILLQCSQMPEGTAWGKNRVDEVICDLQIIIPAYNVERYIEDCIDSVLQQDTKYSYKIILIDDGSTDETGVIADKYISDPRVQVIHQENKGFSGARNTGLQSLFARYIMFIDSDDMLCPGAIETLLHAAYLHDCDVVEGGVYFEKKSGRIVEYQHDVAQYVNACEKLHGYSFAKVYKSHLFSRMCFPQDFWFEDTIYAFLLWPVVKRAYVVHEMVYVYRSNPEGITLSYYGKPKSIDTYWITERLFFERMQRELPMDETFFSTMLKQLRMNQERLKYLRKGIQQSAFELSCELIMSFFSMDLIDASEDPIADTIKCRDFETFRIICVLKVM